MNSSQSFPLLPKSILYQRMFRHKPYTKCMQCLANTRLKCRQCMENIIEDISHNSVPKKTMLNRKISSSPMSSTTSMSLAKPLQRVNVNKGEVKIMVMSKYSWWMGQKQRRRGRDVQDFKENWPRKTRINDASLQMFGAKQPKFQKWEKKLLDQLLSKSKRMQ